jgi:RNA polymerase sigma factor (sigma-70 family)
VEIRVDFSKQTDEDIMLALCQGNEQAFAVLYARYSAKVFAYLLSKISDRPAAEDLLQEIFLKVYRFKFQYKKDLSFKAWLFTISRNTFFDFLRSKPERTQVEIDKIQIEAVQSSEEETNIDLSVLSAAEREVLSLRFQEDLSFNSIAQKLTISAANARQIASRSIRKLKELLS